MPDINRRGFLQLAGATAAFSAMANSIEQAAAIPAHRQAFPASATPPSAPSEPTCVPTKG